MIKEKGNRGDHLPSLGARCHNKTDEQRHKQASYQGPADQPEHPDLGVRPSIVRVDMGLATEVKNCQCRPFGQPKAKAQPQQQKASNYRTSDRPWRNAESGAHQMCDGFHTLPPIPTVRGGDSGLIRIPVTVRQLRYVSSFASWNFSHLAGTT